MDRQGRDIILKVYEAVKEYVENNTSFTLNKREIQATTNANGYIFTDIPATTTVLFCYGWDYPAIPITYEGYWAVEVCHPVNGVLTPDASVDRGVTIIYADITPTDTTPTEEGT